MNTDQKPCCNQPLCSDLVKEKEELFKESKKRLTELKSASNPLMKQFRDIENMITAKSKEIINQETGFKASVISLYLGLFFLKLDKNGPNEIRTKNFRLKRIFALLEEFVLHFCRGKSYFLMKILHFLMIFFAYFSKCLNSRCITEIESHCVLLSLSACNPLSLLR